MPGAAAAIDTSWSVSAEPELVIGVRAGDPRYEFFRVSGVAQRPDGRIAVVIHGTHEVRLYDEEGSYLHSLGGRGAGPGEFVGPNLIPARTYDSLVVADARRISVIGEDDSVRVVGSIRVPFLPALSVGKGILFRGSASSGRPASNGLVTGRIQYRLVDLQDDQSVVIADVISRMTFSVPGDQGGRLGGSIPFTVPPSHAPASRGVYLAQGMDPEILQYDLDGERVRTIRLPLEREAVPASAFRAAVAERRAASRRVLERLGQPTNQTFPLVSDLVADPVGGVWVQVYSAEEGRARRWLVVDVDGTMAGEVVTPAALEVAQVGLDFVLGLQRDELGTEKVVRYRLRRPSGRDSSR